MIENFWFICAMCFMAGALSVFVLAGIIVSIGQWALSNRVLAALLSAIAGYRAMRDHK